VLRATLDLVALASWGQAHGDAPGAAEVIAPERRARGSDRLVVRAGQMNATGQRLSRTVVDVDVQVTRWVGDRSRGEDGAKEEREHGYSGPK